MGRQQIICFWAVVLAGLLGCSRNTNRLAVSGTVTIDGRPLASGLISFQALENTVSGTGTAIEQGRYELPAQRGLLPGKYRVIIQGFRETGRVIKDPQIGKDIPEIVPIRFNNADALDVVVTEKGPNRFDFNLTGAH